MLCMSKSCSCSLVICCQIWYTSVIPSFHAKAGSKVMHALAAALLVNLDNYITSFDSR